jgi:hypothetical protein
VPLSSPSAIQTYAAHRVVYAILMMIVARMVMDQLSDRPRAEAEHRTRIDVYHRLFLGKRVASDRTQRT